MITIAVCVGSCCHAKGADQIIQKLQKLLAQYGLEDKITLKGEFCMGHCTNGVSIKWNGEVIPGVTCANLEEVLLSRLNK